MGSIVSVHCVAMLCTYCALLGTVWHSLWYVVTREYNGQLHPNSSRSPIQLHFDKYSTGRTVLSIKAVHNAYGESGDKCSAGQTVLSIKGSAHRVGDFSTMMGGG